MTAITFNKAFYAKEAIKKAIIAYKKLADFEIKDGKKYVKVILKNVDKDVKNVIEGEFSNYVLGINYKLFKR